MPHLGFGEPACNARHVADVVPWPPDLPVESDWTPLSRPVDDHNYDTACDRPFLKCFYFDRVYGCKGAGDVAKEVRSSLHLVTLPVHQNRRSVKWGLPDGRSVIGPWRRGLGPWGLLREGQHPAPRLPPKLPDSVESETSVVKQDCCRWRFPGDGQKPVENGIDRGRSEAHKNLII